MADVLMSTRMLSLEYVWVCCFKDPATTKIYTYGHNLSLHDALPIYAAAQAALDLAKAGVATAEATRGAASGQLAASDALVRGSTIDTDPAVQIGRAHV